MVRENLQWVQERVAAAAQTAGRDPAEIRLIAVTKGVPVDRIREAIACGVREIGENRVQEAREKKQALGTVPEGDCPPIAWHLIGHLQRNKAGAAAELFDCIHSVDSSQLAEALDKACKRKLEVLIQVNVSGEPTKHGCTPEALPVLAQAVSRCSNLRLSGLMTMAPFSEDPEQARPVFRTLRLLRDELQGKGFSLPQLSMGMSHDFGAAVQEGATMVRIGTAIFGERTA